jgi:hypothetical protein
MGHVHAAAQELGLKIPVTECGAGTGAHSPLAEWVLPSHPAFMDCKRLTGHPEVGRSHAELTVEIYLHFRMASKISTEPLV